MSKEKYCPACLNPLDENGDCWPVCNYESKDALPEYAPLNRKQVLEKLLFNTNAKINIAFARITQWRIDAENYEQEIKSLESQALEHSSSTTKNLNVEQENTENTEHTKGQPSKTTIQERATELAEQIKDNAISLVAGATTSESLSKRAIEIAKKAEALALQLRN